MCFVGNHGKAFALGSSQLADLVESLGKCLNRADNNLLLTRERFGQFRAFAACIALDGRDDASRALKAVDRILQLTVDDFTIGDYQHRVEQLTILSIVQVGQEVCGPGDRVGLAGSGGVLDEILVARPFAEHGLLELACGIELVVTREDDLGDLLLVVLLCHQVPPEDLQPAIALPDLLPQVSRAIAVGLTGLPAAPLSP